jgi:hypothetical protein
MIPKTFKRSQLFFRDSRLSHVKLNLLFLTFFYAFPTAESSKLSRFISLCRWFLPLFFVISIKVKSNHHNKSLHRHSITKIPSLGERSIRLWDLRFLKK